MFLFHLSGLRLPQRPILIILSKDAPLPTLTFYPSGTLAQIRIPSDTDCWGPCPELLIQ